MFYIQTINFFLALGGLGLLIATVVLYVDYFFYQSKLYALFLKQYIWYVVLLITLASVFLTLLYSEYFGFVPCSLCWLQRIALYPQALFALMAFKTKESVYFPLYSIGLSLFGFVVGIYQHIYQMIPKDGSAGMILPCLADGTADCAERILFEFGFMTFPLLSAITFAFLIVVYLNLRRSSLA